MNVPVGCHVDPPFIEYEYVPYPPRGSVMVIVPLFAPKHVTFVLVTVAESTAGSVISKGRIQSYNT